MYPSGSVNSSAVGWNTGASCTTSNDANAGSSASAAASSRVGTAAAASAVAGAAVAGAAATAAAGALAASCCCRSSFRCCCRDDGGRVAGVAGRGGGPSPAFSSDEACGLIAGGMACFVCWWVGVEGLCGGTLREGVWIQAPSEERKEVPHDVVMGAGEGATPPGPNQSIEIEGPTRTRVVA